MKYAVILLSILGSRFSILPYAEAAEPKIVHLLFASDMDLSSGADLLSPLTEVLSSDTAHIRIERIDTLKAHYSRDTFTFALPGEGGALRGSAFAAIDSPKDSLFLFTTGYNLLERVLAAATRPGGDVPGAFLRPARLLPARLPDGSDGLAIGFADKAPSSWRASHALAYHLRVDGRPMTVVAVGKPRGGPARTRALLARRRADIQEAVVQFSAGFVVMPPEFPAEPDEMLRTLRADGNRFVALDIYDIEFGWDTVRDYAARPPERGGLPFLATNLKPAEGTVSPFQSVRIEESGGVRVGFLNLLSARARPMLAKRRADFTIEDPIASARSAIKALREKEKVDLVVVVSHLGSLEDRDLLREGLPIDIYLEGRDPLVGSSRRETVDLDRWNHEPHYLPVLRVRSPMHSYDELACRFHGSGGRLELERIEHLPGPTDPAIPAGEGSTFEERMLDYLIVPHQTLLPEARSLWPEEATPKMNYKAAEFWNLAAQMLRRDAGVEVAFLRISDLQSNTAGGLGEGYIRQWMDATGKSVVFKLPGSVLKALLKRAPFMPVPVKDETGVHYSDVALAVAGADKKGRVGGVPITDSELYSVATTEELLANDEAPEFLKAQEVRPTGRNLSDLVIASLERRDKGPAGDADLRRDLEGKTPPATLWRLNLREASLQFADTQVAGNQSLSGIPDARVSADSQVVTQGKAKLFSELYSGRLRWDAGVSADYGKVTIKPAGTASFTNVTRDRLTVETEVRYCSRWVETGRLAPYALGPFTSLSYNTQFSKPPASPRSQSFTVKAGAKLFDGSHLKELYVAPVATRDYSVPEPHAHFGGAAGLRWDSAIGGGPVYLKGQAEYVEYARETYDAYWDLRRTLDVTVKLSVPFYKDLQLSPFASYYLFEGKVPDRTGYNVLFGVSLEFSRLWKPVF